MLINSLLMQVTAHAQMTQKGSGQLSMQLETHEFPQLGLLALLPFASKLFGKFFLKGGADDDQY